MEHFFAFFDTEKHNFELMFSTKDGSTLSESLFL